jgi:transposase-like protein
MTKRRKHSADFKAKVAVEAIKENKTLAELGSAYQVNPQQVQNWKSELLANAQAVFEGKVKAKHREAELAKVEAAYKEEIGFLHMAIKLLKKNVPPEYRAEVQARFGDL